MQIQRKKLAIIASLLLVLSVSVVYAGYLVTTQTSSAVVLENISYTLTHDFSDIYPGESTSWAFSITNVKPSSQDVMIKDVSVLPTGVSITGVTVDGNPYTGADLIAGITQSVPASGSLAVSITVTASSDCATGAFTVTITIERV